MLKNMNNSIIEKIASFLKQYEPFQYLSFDDLKLISKAIRILNLEKDKSIFAINDELHDCFYVVYSGVLHLTVISDSEEILLNKCYSGDIFGLRPFFAKNNYQMNAKAREESVIYAIPIETFKPFLAKNSEILNFLLESFAANSKSSLNKENTNRVLSDNIMFAENQSDTSFFQSLNYNKKPLLFSQNATIKEVAQLMSDNLQDNALIIENNFPIGIVTDTDFRAKIATGRFEITAPIQKIMNSPVITVSESVSVAESQLIMLKYGLSHLCVTQDGSEKSEIKGVISEHDLVVAQANNPGVLLKEIKHSQNATDLKKIRENLTEIIQSSISKNIPLTHINTIAGEITLALIKRCIELAILELGSPPANFAWLCIGSQGRKEQLLMTNQDSILVFDDVETRKYRDVRDYFMQLAKKTTHTLEQMGYKNSPEGYIASNVNWCKSLTDWRKQYESWINTPGEKSNTVNTIFFDYEIAFGDQKIEDAITETIFKNLNTNTLFLDYLGNDALRKPAPLNFFKKFNVEEDGENRNKFDIKAKGLLPLIDAARVLILSLNIKGINSTYLRFKQLAIIDPRFSETYLNCAEAFLVLSKFRTLEGLKNDNSGQYIDLEELSKADKEKLKSALAPMRDLEELIKSKIQLTQFS
jgi:CBS domain-containing protein